VVLVDQTQAVAANRRSQRNLYDRLRPLRRLARPIEATQVRLLGKSVLSIAFRTQVLVLHSTGRRSGIVRSTTLAFHRLNDQSLVLVGGAGGQARTPDWVANLRANSCAAVSVDRTLVEVQAEELTGADREEMWRDLRKVWPQIDTYEKRGGRDVPVFRLVAT
jgi:deazaflavin-dependent oxidoreductase (nitroreductase family)